MKQIQTKKIGDTYYVYGEFDATKQTFTSREWESLWIGVSTVLLLVFAYLLGTIGGV
jgi:hypothetical protein